MLKIFLIITTIVVLNCGDRAGIKIAVKQDVILNFEKKFLPLAIEELGKLNIPDTTIDLSAGFLGTLHIYLTNIKFQIRNLIAENIQIIFLEPDRIRVQANQIQGSGQLDCRFKLGFISESDNININVRNVNIVAEATLTTQESTKERGKLMPSAFISRIDLDIDFDFDIHGSVIAFMAGLVKSEIKSYINNQIQSGLRQVIMDESKKLIYNLVDSLPVYVNVADNGLALDYSLLSPPKISNGYLILNSNGAIVNLNVPESKNPPFEFPTDLPDYDANGKFFQFFLSQYSINTAINTIFLSNMLDLMIRSEEVPIESPIQFNTTSLEQIFSGISGVYGKNKLTDVHFKVISIPGVVVTEKQMNTTVIAEISILVRLDNGTVDECLKFNTTIVAAWDLHVFEQGQITADVHNINVKNSKKIIDKIPDSDIFDIEIMFNFATSIIIPILNNNYLKKISVKLPIVDGISFEESTVDINNGYAELNVSPRFQNNLFQIIWQKRCALLEKETKMQGFLDYLN